MKIGRMLVKNMVFSLMLTGITLAMGISSGALDMISNWLFVAALFGSFVLFCLVDAFYTVWLRWWM